MHNSGSDEIQFHSNNNSYEQQMLAFRSFIFLDLVKLSNKKEIQK